MENEIKEAIEQAHMAGQKCSGNIDPSYSDASAYHQSFLDAEKDKPKYSENDLYKIGMQIIGNQYGNSKRIDILDTWAKEAVCTFLEEKEESEKEQSENN